MVMSIHEKEEPQKKQWGRYLIGIVCFSAVFACLPLRWAILHAPKG